MLDDKITSQTIIKCIRGISTRDTMYVKKRKIDDWCLIVVKYLYFIMY